MLYLCNVVLYILTTTTNNFNNIINFLKFFIMKQVNLFSSNLEGKALRHEISETKKAVSEALRDYEGSINAAFTQVIKSTDKRSRDCANAAKGTFGTAVAVVAGCYPYQTANGTLCRKRTTEDGTRIWDEKKLTAAAARGIVRDALKNFAAGVGTPSVSVVVIGAPVE